MKHNKKEKGKINGTNRFSCGRGKCAQNLRSLSLEKLLYSNYKRMSPLIQWTATDNGAEELIACFIGEPEANLSLSFPKNTTK